MSIILGLFLHQNKDDFWFYFAATILAILNIYILLFLIEKIFQSQFKGLLHDILYLKEKHDQTNQMIKLTQERKQIF